MVSGIKFNKIKVAIINYPYSIIFIISFFGFILLNALINKTYITLPSLVSNKQFFYPYILLNRMIGPFFFALVINLAYIRVRSLGIGGLGSGSHGMIGSFVGLIGGACPGCLIGLFPAVLGLFGVSASLSVFPLFGFEIQMLSVILLLVSVHFLSKEAVCKIK